MDNLSPHGSQQKCAVGTRHYAGAIQDTDTIKDLFHCMLLLTIHRICYTPVTNLYADE